MRWNTVINDTLCVFYRIYVFYIKVRCFMGGFPCEKSGFDGFKFWFFFLSKSYLQKKSKSDVVI